LQKGVALSHRAIFNQVNSYARALRLDTQDGVVSWLPLYHDMGLIAGFLLPILSGIPLTLMSPFDWVRAPARLLQAASQQRATLTWLPNFAYNFLAQKVRLPELEGMDLSCLRSVINCSEPVNWKSHQMFLERYQPYGLRPAALATCYAMAENVFAVTQAGIDQPVNIDRIDAARLAQAQVAMPSNDPQALPMLSCGKPVDGTRLRVLGADGELLPERSIGEIAIQSDCMLTGYFNRPDLTRQAFLDGWYLTGDLGYLADGELYVTGRKKDLIIVGGKNIYPQDLERLAGEVPGVYPGRVAAFGIFNERLGTEEAALVAETELEGELQRQRIGDEIRQAVTRGSDIALRLVLVVERNWLLKTSSGKISRAANREKFLSLINGGEE
jgi:acyl-CoA synthetase (AMP-forming)/AMP-acid ligase II